MSAEPRYQLTVTRAQAEVLRDACELLARCRLGQIADACQQVLDEHGKAGVPYDLAMLGITNGEGQNAMNYDLEQWVDTGIKPAMGLAMNASFGVGKFVDADNLFDLHETIRHRLSWDAAEDEGLVQPGGQRLWREMWGICYDKPMRWGDQPLAVVAKIEEVT